MAHQSNSCSSALSRVLVALVALLICKVTVSVLIEYRNYFPPSFS
jgi:hypothetical protein